MPFLHPKSWPMVPPKGAPITEAKAETAPRMPMDAPCTAGGHVSATATITETNENRYPESQIARAPNAAAKPGAMLKAARPAATVTSPPASTVLSPNRFASIPAGTLHRIDSSPYIPANRPICAKFMWKASRMEGSKGENPRFDICNASMASRVATYGATQTLPVFIAVQEARRLKARPIRASVS